MNAFTWLFDNPGHALGTALLTGLAFAAGQVFNRRAAERDANFGASVAIVGKLWDALMDADHALTVATSRDNNPPTTDESAAGFAKLALAGQTLQLARGHLSPTGYAAARDWVGWYEGAFEHVAVSHLYTYEDNHGNPDLLLDKFHDELTPRLRKRIAPRWREWKASRKKA